MLRRLQKRAGLRNLPSISRVQALPPNEARKQRDGEAIRAPTISIYQAFLETVPSRACVAQVKLCVLKDFPGVTHEISFESEVRGTSEG